MATRRDIREAFQGHLEKASEVESNNVRQDEPSTEEDLPALVYRGSYRKVPMNRASGAPVAVERNEDGDATAERYQTVHEAQIGVGLFDHDEQRREDIYEDVRSYFEKYEHPAWDASHIQEDVTRVQVLNADPEDDVDRSPSQRGDRLIIQLQFTRDHVKEVEHVNEVDRTTE